MRHLHLKDLTHALLLALSLSIGACTTTTTLPDGSVQVQQLDTDTIKLLSTISVATWAASQKDGIQKADAQQVVRILDAITVFHLDGSPIKSEAWMPVVQKEVAPRYQALAMALIELVSHELDKRGLASTVPVPGNDADKIMRAIYEGAMIGLRPYL